MPTSPLNAARTWSVALLAGGAVGASAVGFHLANSQLDADSATQSSPQSQSQAGPLPGQQGQRQSNSTSGFAPVAPPQGAAPAGPGAAAQGGGPAGGHTSSAGS